MLRLVTHILLVLLLLALVASRAEARPKHHHRHHSAATQRLEAVSQRLDGCSDAVMRLCDGMFIFSSSNEGEKMNMARAGARKARPTPPGLRRVMAEGAGRVVAHPRGCPRRAFCGCGAAVRIFGKPIRSLWRAANWFRFPRTSPAPGMVAVRRHHVFVLLRHVRGSIWRVYDANSGRHRTRVHRRSIAGWTIVDPRAGS